MHNKYLAPIIPTASQLKTSVLKKRIQISESILVNKISKTSDWILWKCFLCSTEIPVWYKEENPRYLYCPKCRPKTIHKPDALLLRYHLIFTKTVNEHIKENSNITDII